MHSRFVRVVGGGPAGLFAARALKRAHPQWEVRLYERLPAEDTFGFGVGLSARTLDAVRAADAEVAGDLVAAAHRYSSGQFRLPRGTVEIPGFHSGVAIGRAALLRCLVRRAEEAGVKIEIGTAPPVEELSAEADLVIAADGVNSAIRTALADRFEPQIADGRGNFFWCGAPVVLDGTVFAPVRTDVGVFTAHAYPYSDERSTIVIDAGDETLRKAGLDTAAFGSDAASDERSLAFLTEIFAPLVDGAELIGNRSRWTHFRTVRCARWASGNVVVLGDAAATAHPTIGSGTKLALESAIALASALGDPDAELGAALASYEQTRRPSVDRFQTMATRSQLWWDSFDRRLGLDPNRLAAGFLSRAGAVSLDTLADSGPDLARRAAAAYAGVDPAEVPADGITEWVLTRPLDTSNGRFASRLVDPAPDALAVDSGDAWGPPGDAVLDAARGLVDGGAAIVRLTGPSSADDLRDRLATGERLRGELGVTVQVGGPRHLLGELADGLLAGRTDLVCLEDGERDG